MPPSTPVATSAPAPLSATPAEEREKLERMLALLHAQLARARDDGDSLVELRARAEEDPVRFAEGVMNKDPAYRLPSPLPSFRPPSLNYALYPHLSPLSFVHLRRTPSTPLARIPLPEPSETAAWVAGRVNAREPLPELEPDSDDEPVDIGEPTPPPPVLGAGGKKVKGSLTVRIRARTVERSVSPSIRGMSESPAPSTPGWATKAPPSYYMPPPPLPTPTIKLEPTPDTLPPSPPSPQPTPTTSKPAKPRPANFNQPWTIEEQHTLEHLLSIIPPGTRNRMVAIAERMGTRTSRQVASRVQKYFKALEKVGLGEELGAKPKEAGGGTKRKAAGGSGGGGKKRKN